MENTGAKTHVVLLKVKQAGKRHELTDVLGGDLALDSLYTVLTLAQMQVNVDMTDAGRVSHTVHEKSTRQEREIEIVYDERNNRLGKVYVKRHNLDNDILLISLLNVAVARVMAEFQRASQTGIMIPGQPDFGPVGNG